MSINSLIWIGSYQNEKMYSANTFPLMGQASAYASQKGLVNGLKSCFPDCRFYGVGVIAYPPYPIFPSKNVPEETYSDDKDYVCLVGYKNRKLLNYLYRERALCRKAKRLLVNRNGESIVFVYAPTPGKIKSALALKKKYKSRVCVIIPDIPELINPSAGRVVKLLKGLSSIYLKRKFKKIDKFVLYSRHMADYYHFDKDKWIEVEGVYDEKEAGLPDDHKREPSPFKVMYCGSLDERRGIKSLIEACQVMDCQKPVELILCGKGDCEPFILDYSKDHPFLKYKGFIKDRKTILELESHVDCLVHLWDVNLPGSKYGFPSKMMEYLASGKIVIAPKMDAIPDEYYDYIVKINSSKKSDILEGLKEAYSSSSLRTSELIEKQIFFIKNNKTPEIQAKKILDFVLRD